MSVHIDSHEQRKDRRIAQAATADAPAYLLPWTPADDRELVHGRGTVAERARRLGRTYYASQARLARLRQLAPLELERFGQVTR